MAENDYYSFEEVLKDLKLEEDELKRLVSAGEIRAFRDKNTMRFKAEDIARLRGRRVESQDVELDDLELELEDDAERPAAELGSETLELDVVSESEELVLEEASPTGSGEIIDLGDASEPEPVVSTSTVRASRAGGGARKAPKAAAVAAPVESITEGGAMLALMLVGALLLVIANFLVLDAAVGRTSSALTRAVANMFS